MANSARDGRIIDGRIGDLLAGIVPRHRKAWQKYLAALQAELGGIERDLASLPDESWAALKGNILRQIDQRRPEHSWPQVCDLLHEARAYRYLTELGCTEIHFSSPSMLAKSPDLTARLGAQTVLCEVKTINIATPDPRGLLSHVIFKKLASRLKDACNQLMAHEQNRSAQRIIYIVINVRHGRDDSLTTHITQMKMVAAKVLQADTQIVFDLASGRNADINIADLP
ncbi:hypothetical protein [Dongia sp.]|uniref:hypothetical protein n=1 Tax=Dongia sp. TaxID=1977262 RepID=UPI0035AE4B5F